jgi:acyl-CoA synthetase (AMP-forming)/AMP-acid ligase II
MFFDSAHLLSFRTAPALIEESGATISYVELEVRVQAFAARLNRGRGLLALKVSNSASCIIAYLGALRAGTPVLFST